MKGFFIPLEFGKLKLTQIEEKLLATYRYYTLLKNGYHHCALSNKKLAEMLYANERSIKRAKKKLKELGYIKTNGGIRVWYVGIGVEETETVDDVEEVDETEMTETETVEEQVNEQVNETVDEVEEQVNKTEITENEEVIKEVDETDNKKDIVMEKSKSNVERIIDTLGDFYKTPEKLKYFYDKQQEWVDKINQADYEELTISTYASQIKFVINTKFGYPEVAAIPNTKKEVKSEEFESCFM